MTINDNENNSFFWMGVIHHSRTEILGVWLGWLGGSLISRHRRGNMYDFEGRR